MRVLICGDRNWTDETLIEDYILSLETGSVIIQGEAPGADTIAKRLGEKHGFTVQGFEADWDKYGNGAGPIRNTQMLVEGKPDKVVAFHNDLSKSKGTANMIKQAKRLGVPVEIKRSGSVLTERKFFVCPGCGCRFLIQTDYDHHQTVCVSRRR